MWVLCVFPGSSSRRSQSCRLKSKQLYRLWRTQMMNGGTGQNASASQRPRSRSSAPVRCALPALGLTRPWLCETGRAPSSASSAKAAAPGPRIEPTSLRVKMLHETKAKEQAGKAAAKQQKEAELAAARMPLSQPIKHRSLTDAEKAARKEARRVVRARKGPKRRRAGPRTGDIEVARGHGLQAATTKGRGPLCKERSLQQTLEHVGDVPSSSSDQKNELPLSVCECADVNTNMLCVQLLLSGVEPGHCLQRTSGAAPRRPSPF